MEQKVSTTPTFKNNIARLVQQRLQGPTIWTLANWFTFIRIFISPIFLIIYLQYQDFGISKAALPYVLLSLLGFSELSDAFDGYLARKYDQVTDLGKILDPMADSISRISVFLTFTQPPVHIPLVCIFIFICRDSVTSTLRTICALRGFALAARQSGKIKAVIQAVCSFVITLLLIPHSLGHLSDKALNQISCVFVLVAAFYSVYSAFDYVISNQAHIRRVLIRKPKIARKGFSSTSSYTKETAL